MEEPKRKTKARAGEADRLIGARVQKARLDAVMSQAGLGQAVGVTFQQVQKWENGENRIMAAMLVKIAEATNRPVAYFLADLIPHDAWGVSGSLLKMLDALEIDQRLFLEDFVSMTQRQRECVGMLTRDLAAAYKHKSAENG